MTDHRLCGDTYFHPAAGSVDAGGVAHLNVRLANSSLLPASGISIRFLIEFAEFLLFDNAAGFVGFGRR